MSNRSACCFVVWPERGPGAQARLRGVVHRYRSGDPAPPDDHCAPALVSEVFHSPEQVADGVQVRPVKPKPWNPHPLTGSGFPRSIVRSGAG